MRTGIRGKATKKEKSFRMLSEINTQKYVESWSIKSKCCTRIGNREYMRACPLLLFSDYMAISQRYYPPISEHD